MKKMIVFAAALVAGCSDMRDNPSIEKGGRITSEYHGGSFNTGIYIFVDAKSGCEFFYVDGYKSGVVSVIPGTCKTR